MRPYIEHREQNHNVATLVAFIFMITLLVNSAGGLF